MKESNDTGYFTPDMLLTTRNILISSRLTDIEIKNLLFLPDNAIVEIKEYTKELSESEYLKNVLNILNKINELKKTLIVKFSLEKRSLLKKLHFDFSKYINLSIIINNDNYDYPLGQFLEEEHKLDALIKNINFSNLSQLEKYIAVYNIVKNFKPYKDNKSNPSKARDLRNILNNRYMVCEGYARLLEVLLDKVDINAICLDVSVDTSYDNSFDVSEQLTNDVGHKRIIVNIDDDVYNIHGIFVADPTWDNDLERNYFTHALMPFEMMQVEKRLFWLNDEDLIFDVHNFAEFNNKINYYITKQERFYQEIPEVLFPQEKNQLNLLIYGILEQKIADTLGKIDPNYQTIVRKYNFNSKKDYEDFLTEIGHYIIKRTNQKINGNILIDANNKVLEHSGLPLNLLEKQEKQTTTDNIEFEFKEIPYQIPDDDTSNANLEENQKNRFNK